jgi:hypothetical protein
MALVPGAHARVDEGATIPDDAVGTMIPMVVSRETVVPAWYDESNEVSSLVYRDEVPLLAREERARFECDAGARGAAGAVVSAPVTVDVERIDAPPLARDRATVRVRWRVPKPSPLRGGEVGWLTLEARQRTAEVVPYPAVLQQPSGPYVLVLADDGSIAARPVETGRVFVGLIAVSSGLTQKDRILVDHAPLFDAERRLVQSRAQAARAL